MAHWGVAYALGPNYNKPWEAFDEADLRTSTVTRAPRPYRAAGQTAAGVDAGGAGADRRAALAVRAG